MTDWTPDELNRLGAAEELQMTTRRGDGSLRGWVPIWIVRVGSELYVRSYRGEAGAWYRHATAHPRGRIRAAGIERDVTFERPDATDTAARAAIDAAYRDKYGRYGETYLRPMLADQAVATTLRLLPQD
jgi:hypothetical protein